MWRDLQHWIFSLTPGETWVFGGGMALILWLGIILPLAYRIILVPWASAPFWTRMGDDPKAAVALMLLLVALGPATLWIGFLVLPFVLLVGMFKPLFRFVFRGRITG